MLHRPSVQRQWTRPTDDTQSIPALPGIINIQQTKTQNKAEFIWLWIDKNLIFGKMYKITIFLVTFIQWGKCWHYINFLNFQMQIFWMKIYHIFKNVVLLQCLWKNAFVSKNFKMWLKYFCKITIEYFYNTQTTNNLNSFFQTKNYAVKCMRFKNQILHFSK